MGKITDALKKAAQEKLARIERLEQKHEIKYQFIAKKTAESKIDPRVVAFYDKQSPVTEQYRTLRTNIQALSKERPIRAIAISSAIHGEGKTITAINLAMTMAHDLDSKNVLLVDADLRRAKISKYLGIEPETGLADLLANGANTDEALLDIGMKNLTFLPAGKIPKNPVELLGSLKMKNLIANLKTKFDYLIFDTPPIIPVTDAGVLGSQTDGVIMVVQANRTQQGVIRHGEALIRQAQAKVLGYILTNVQYHIPAYIYRYL